LERDLSSTAANSNSNLVFAEPMLALAFDYVDSDNDDDTVYRPSSMNLKGTRVTPPSSSPYLPPPGGSPLSMPSSRKVSGGGGGRYRCPKVNLKKKKKTCFVM
jgi:hypothetical protein